jgi:HEAT repeat protein
VIPLLVEMLDHSDKSLRDAAAYGLNRIGPESWDEIERILGSTASEGRKAVLFTLTSRLSNPVPDPSQAEAERILTIFLDACADPDPEIQLLGVGGLLNCQAFYSYHFAGLNLLGRAGPVLPSDDYG